MTPIPPSFLTRGEADDAPALLALERRCFSHPWTVQHFRDALADERTDVLVLRARPDRAPGTEIVAYCIVQTVLDEAHIHDLGVAPELRRRGLARWLLGVALGRASRLGARRAFLEVRQSNWPAVHLYRSLGFEVVSVRRDYYERPAEDALVLRKEGFEGGE
jgi:[ribosomal protein S18]-alanine N-acetyltransferase